MSASLLGGYMHTLILEPNWVEREIALFRTTAHGRNILAIRCGGKWGDPLPGNLQADYASPSPRTTACHSCNWGGRLGRSACRTTGMTVLPSASARPNS